MARTDAELLIASRDDPHAFRELYDRWADKLLAYFYRRTLDPEVAGDLLAETFAVAFARRGRFRDVGRPGARCRRSTAPRARRCSGSSAGSTRSRARTTPALRRSPAGASNRPCIP
jgi:hypothetical protein